MGQNFVCKHFLIYYYNSLIKGQKDLLELHAYFYKVYFLLFKCFLRSKFLTINLIMTINKIEI